MNNKAKSYVIAVSFSLLFLLINYNSCGVVEFKGHYKLQDTVIGNPMAPVSNKIISSMCNVINRCNSEVSISHCQKGLLSTSGFEGPLGLSTTYSTLNSIFLGEQSGALSENSVASNRCTNSIESLSCNDPLVQSAYDTSLANPFQSSPQMIPSNDCDQVFATLLPVVFSSPNDGVAVRNDLENAINQARSGGYVGILIPEGTYPFTGTLYSIDDIEMHGEGIGKTILEKNDTSTEMIEIECSTGNSFKFTGIQLKGFGRVNHDQLAEADGRITNGELDFGQNYPNDFSEIGLSLIGQCNKIEIYNNRFSHFTRSAIEIVGYKGGVTTPKGQPTGIVHSNEFYYNFLQDEGHAVYVGGGANIVSPVSLSLGGSESVFIEDNNIEFSRHAVNVGNFGKIVARHNTVINNFSWYSAFHSDGERTSPLGGSVGFEFYENDTYFDSADILSKGGRNMNCSPTPCGVTGYPYGIGITGGNGIVFNNRFYHQSGGFGHMYLSVMGSDTYLTNYKTSDLYQWNNQDLSSTPQLLNFVIGYDAASTSLTNSWLSEGNDYFNQIQYPGYVPFPYPHPDRSN